VTGFDDAGDRRREPVIVCHERVTVPVAGIKDLFRG
jgi:hypothetical protein